MYFSLRGQVLQQQALYHITLTQAELKCRHLTFDDIVLYLLQFKLYSYLIVFIYIPM